MSLTVQVVSPEAVLYHGPARAVVAPAWNGLLGILPRHAPMLALLGKGPLTVRAPEGDKRFQVAGGFLQVNNDTVRIVAEEATAGS